MEYWLSQRELSQQKLQNPWGIITKFQNMFAKGAVTDGMMMMHIIVSIVVTLYNKGEIVMTHEKGKFRLIIERMKFEEFKVLWIIIALGTVFYIGVVMDEIDTAAKLDAEKDVYLFLHGRDDLQEEAENILITLGFPKQNIIVASSKNVGDVGDYMAMLWRPPRPDQIKIQQITMVKDVEPDKMFGLWKGVLKKDIDSFLLK